MCTDNKDTRMSIRSRATAGRPVGKWVTNSRNNITDTRIDVSISKPNRHYEGDGKKERRRERRRCACRYYRHTAIPARLFFSSRWNKTSSKTTKREREKEKKRDGPDAHQPRQSCQPFQRGSVRAVRARLPET